MLYYIIIHTEAELTSLLPGRGAWAHIIISKGGFQGGPRGYLRGVGAPCRGYFGIATPGGDPPNTHTHGDGGARPSPSNGGTRCAELRAAELRAAMRAPLPSRAPTSSPCTEQPQGRATSAGSPSPPSKSAQRKTTPLSLRRDAQLSPHRCGSAWLRRSRLRASPRGPRAEPLLTRHQRVEQLGEGLLL